MFVHINPNKNGLYAEDCVIRAISFLTYRSWDRVYFDLCVQGYLMGNMPSVNEVWGNYLKSMGFVKLLIPNRCPLCYTVRDFCYDNQNGSFLLVTGSHVIAVIDGNYYDAWDSGNEVPIGVWEERDMVNNMNYNGMRTAIPQPVYPSNYGMSPFQQIFVQGIEGARAYQLPYGVNAAVLWDSEKDLYYSR